MAKAAPGDNLLTYRQWRGLAQQKRAPKACKVFMGRAAEVSAVEGEPRRIRFVITTADLDRYNDTIDPAGWEWEGWERAGAPVFYQHFSWELPVAQGIDTAAERGGIASTADFGEPGEDAFVDRLYTLCARGRIKGASVGFLPLEWSYDEERGGVDIARASLIEWSVTPTPANPAAVQLAIRALGRHAGQAALPPARRAAPPVVPPVVPAPTAALTPDVVRAAVRSAVQTSVGAAVAHATGRLEE